MEYFINHNLRLSYLDALSNLIDKKMKLFVLEDIQKMEEYQDIELVFMMHSYIDDSIFISSPIPSYNISYYFAWADMLMTCECIMPDFNYYSYGLNEPDVLSENGVMDDVDSSISIEYSNNLDSPNLILFNGKTIMYRTYEYISFNEIPTVLAYDTAMIKIAGCIYVQVPREFIDDFKKLSIKSKVYTLNLDDTTTDLYFGNGTGDTEYIINTFMYAPEIVREEFIQNELNKCYFEHNIINEAFSNLFLSYLMLRYDELFSFDMQRFISDDIIPLINGPCDTRDILTKNYTNILLNIPTSYTSTTIYDDILKRDVKSYMDSEFLPGVDLYSEENNKIYLDVEVFNSDDLFN